MAAGLIAAVALALAMITVQRGLGAEGAPPTPARIVADLAESFGRDPRPAMWRGWAEHVTERPWVGIGFGKAVPGEYLQARHPDLPAPGGMIYWDHAHNLFLNTLMQTGAIGVLLLLWLFGALAWRFAQARSTRPAQAWAGLALVVALLVKNATDDFMRDSVALCFWALAGYLLARAHAAREPDAAQIRPPARSPGPLSG
jgi:O-antigen ligase